MTIIGRLALIGAAVALAGCARNLPKDTQAYVKGVQASAAYHDGFTDGCETADLNHDMQKQRRDEDKFSNDPEYRLGWVAGSDNCHDTVFTPSTGNPNHTHPPF
jgi:hypothetical protein